MTHRATASDWLPGYDALSVVVPRRTKARIQVQCEAVLEVLCRSRNGPDHFHLPSKMQAGGMTMPYAGHIRWETYLLGKEPRDL